MYQVVSHLGDPLSRHRVQMYKPTSAQIVTAKETTSDRDELASFVGSFVFTSDGSSTNANKPEDLAVM